VRERRVIFLDPAGDLANALGFSSPLSLPYALDELVPRLAAALDRG
jgi:iron complex transport system substrate-binding protein